MGKFEGRKSAAAKDININERKGMGSNEHWEVTVPCTAYGDDDVASTAFLPTPGYKRAQPHLKINECDH